MVVPVDGASALAQFSPRHSILRVGSEPSMETWMPQLAQSQLLDLAHPFTCQSEPLADLFERHGTILLQSIVEA